MATMCSLFPILQLPGNLMTPSVKLITIVMTPRFQLLPLSTPAAPALPTPLGLPTLASTDTNRPAAAVRRIRDRFAVISNLSKISNQTLFQVAGDSDSSKFLWLDESKLVRGRDCWTMKRIPSLC